jgi:hypothetical protein
MANPRMTIRDIAWSALFMGMFLPLMVGVLFALFAIGGTSLANPSSLPAKLLGGVAVGGVILLSWLTSLFLFGLLTRRFLSIESYERWQLQSYNRTPGVPSPGSPLARCFFYIVKPRQTKNAL